MSYAREFIKDKVLTHDSYYGWDNAVAVVHARWKITNSQYPQGFAYHHFMQELDVDHIERDTFIAIADVTDAILETWCTRHLGNNNIVEIETNSLAEIQRCHRMAQLTTHYKNPDL